MMANDHLNGTMPPRCSSFSSRSSRTLAVLTPCAACRMLRRRCVEKCILAPHFPPDEPLKFTVAHRIFGASNVIKLLQELPESQRTDAVNSMVYEANARIRDPVYGCTGAIFQLQNQVNELQAQLAKAKADVLNIQCQYAALVCIKTSRSPQTSSEESFDGLKNSFDESFQSSNPSFYLDNEQDPLWDTIWA
ncbi:LOB domain-containing protein 1-like [Cynara cardunculus var. scolymus]|uniref:Lateral organ boundaries domain-containing protein n=1 Tax=Cynara cardunculus var. scolymus TaxID=59895 RepID=A0A103YF14_CYNCS|nr:LOB domain-containing protein 1-like [Cynara cardunculus var. scolymus]KVI07895.1 lateral organ boundaries domain-containing protein [Cynara cardunculus var. scolymus]